MYAACAAPARRKPHAIATQQSRWSS